MKREAIATGHTVEDAIQAACDILGVERDRTEFEIIDLPSKRLLGLLGASEAKVKVVFDESVEERTTASSLILKARGSGISSAIGVRPWMRCSTLCRLWRTRAKSSINV
jgi:predicted RNA-binding protein Jag